jgi:two-component system NtrC family sensor kinase
MTTVVRRIFLFFFFLIYLVTAYAQNNTIDSLQKILQTQKEDSNKVKTLYELSQEFQDINDYNAAIQYVNESLSLAQAIKYKMGEGNAYMSLGDIYKSQFNYAESRTNYYASIKIREEIGDKRAGNGYIAIATTYSMEDNYPDAVSILFKALKIYEEAKDKNGMAVTYSGLGGVYNDFGNISEASKYFSLSLKLYEEIGNKTGMAYILINKSQGDLDMGNDSLALDNTLLALKTYKELNNKGGIASATFYIGKIYLKQGEVAYSAGDYLTSKEKIILAEKKCLDALAFFEEIRNYWGRVNSYVTLGNIYLGLRNTQKAKYYLEKCLQLALQSKNKFETRDSYLGIARLDSMRGNYQEAFRNYKLFISYRDSIANQENSIKISNSKLQYESDKKEAIAKIQKEKKEAEVRLTRNLQYTAIGLFLLLAIFLYMNNRQKQKAKTKIEKAYAELKSTQAQLIQSEKMASLGELTAGIAHEIQNPLNFVNNFSDINTELVDEAEIEMNKGNLGDVKTILHDIKENEQKINHHGKRADAIVKGMLQHSRSGSGQREPTDINALADEYLRLAYHGLRAKDKTFNAKLETHFDNTIGKINVIPQDIGRVLVNLINNAFYAAPLPPEGGFKDLDYKHEPTVWVSTKKMGDKVLISVKDNGPGIPRKILDKIFQPFFTTKPTGQGTGLGLSLAYDCVKAHGGEIKVETKEGDGSEFIIQLPIN